jgi:hypothetical protein
MLMLVYQFWRAELLSPTQKLLASSPNTVNVVV